jgi:hypothetical protein
VRIFIDESGTFSRSAKGPSISVVGALIVPDHRWPRIQRKYVELRSQLPQTNGEVKGTRLDEAQIAKVVDLLRANEALFEAAAIDLGPLSASDITHHQMMQARAITKDLTPQHHPNVHREAEGLKLRLESLAPQLYVQSVVMFELIHQMMRRCTIYFCQRQPKELGAFHWEIDGKERNGITDWESWWTSVVMPILQSKSEREPMRHLAEGDYSYMERFQMDVPEWAPREAIPKGREARALNLRLTLMEDFKFCGQPKPGLELVDILVNAVRRALIGNLQPAGFSRIASLMMTERGQCLRLLSITRKRQSRLLRPYDRIIRRYFRRGGRQVLLPRR